MTASFHRWGLLAPLALTLLLGSAQAEEAPETEPAPQPTPVVAVPEPSPAPTTVPVEGPTAYVFRKGNKVVYYRNKIFMAEGQQLIAPLIISYYGENALSILVAPTATLDLNDIHLENGHEYVFDAQGVLARDSAFPTMTIGNTLGAEVPGTFVEGRALIEFDGTFPAVIIEEDRYGVRTLTLATNTWKDPRTESLHLYNGYRIGFNDQSQIESQLAFAEFAINGHLTAAADNYAGPFGAPPSGLGGMPPSYIPSGQPGVYLNQQGIYVDAAGNPVGRPTGEPGADAIKAPEGYMRPAIKVIGIIPFQYEGILGTEDNPRSTATPDFYNTMVTNAFLKSLADVEGIEVKILELAPEDQAGGAYVFGFAKRIGQKYGCDAILSGTVTTLETTAGNRLDNEVKLIGEIQAELIDTTGGRFNWKNSDKVQKFVAKSTYSTSGGTAVKNLIETIAGHLVGDLRAADILKAQEI